MFHDTFSVDDRIHDLQATAAELRAERAAARNGQPGRSLGLRVRIGSALVAMGSGLMSGSGTTRLSSVGR